MTHLVATCGLPGVGKSTVARELAEQLDADCLHTDAVRKEVRADPRYDLPEDRRVYARCLDLAREALGAGQSVVVDGTFRGERFREWAADTAASADAEFTLVRVRCDESVAVERIAGREGELSDASIGTYYEVMESFEPLDRPHVRVDNSQSLAATRRQVAELCDQGLDG